MHKLGFVLIIVGALNWGLVGVGGFVGSDLNVVHLVLGSWPMVEWLVYVLVGVSAVLEVVGHKKNCKECTA